MFGEVFIVQFPFTSGAFSKPRPALVLFDLDQDALICRVTSLLRTAHEGAGTERLRGVQGVREGNEKNCG